MNYQELKNFNSQKYPILITSCFFLIILYVAFFHHNYWIDPDYLTYSNWGDDILSGNGKNVNILNAPPGGPIFYAFLNSFTGDAFLNAKLISLFFGTGIVFVSYYIIRNVFNPKIALLGQLFVVFNPRVDGISIRTINEIIPIFLIFISFFFMTKNQTKISNIMIIGTILGIAFMFRYQPIFILFAFVVFLLIRDKKIRTNLLSVAILVLFFIAAASPMFLYNYYMHGTVIDANPDFEYATKSKYQSPELIEEIKQNIANNKPTRIYLVDFDLFLKNYFYNLFYHNPDKLFNFTSISNTSTIPPIPFLGLIPIFGALIYLLKIQLDKKNLSVLVGTFFGTLFSILSLGDINIHFFALLVMPIIGLTILNFKKIDNNLRPILIAPAIFMVFISIIPVTRTEFFLSIWIVFPALSAVFFIKVIPKIISKTTKASQITKQKL